MNELEISYQPSGDERKHPLMFRDQLGPDETARANSEIADYFRGQQYDPDDLAPFMCGDDSISFAKYSELIRADLIRSLTDVSTSARDWVYEMILCKHAAETAKTPEAELLPETEHFVTFDMPIKKKAHLRAKVRRIRKAPAELGLSTSAWSLLAEEDNE